MADGDAGPGFQTLITPEVFASELARVNDLVTGLARDIATAPPSSVNFRAAWSAFVRRWGGFYASYSDPGWLDVAFSGPFNRIFSFERQAIAWRKAFRDAGGTPTGPEPSPSEPFPDAPDLLGGIGIGAGLAAAAVLGLFLWSRR